MLLLEDSSSQYYGHILKTFLAEGITRDQSNVIVDPEPLRPENYWLKYLPAVSLIKEKVEEIETKTEENKSSDSDQNAQLQVAWRYQDMLEDK